MTIYVVHAVVDKIEEKFKDSNHRSENGAHAYDRKSIGWYVHFVGSTESIKLTDEQPDFKDGDRVSITFRKE